MDYYTIQKMDLCLSNQDILESILDHLEYPEVSALRLVNKDWNTICTQLYQKKLIDVQNKTYEISQQYYKSIEEIPGFINIVPNIIQNFIHYVDSIYAVDWCIFVHEIDFMENIFHIGTELHFHRYEWDVIEYNRVINKIRPYLYIENPHVHTCIYLKKLCAFKGVRGCYSMNKVQLCKKLTRPEDELYYFTKPI